MISVALMFLANATVEPQPAKPIGNPGDWVTTSDYPPPALRSYEQGITSFRLEIDRNGKVTSCLIVSGSGSFTLDDATCSLVSERARFTPARDARGRPTSGNYYNRVRWVLPESVDVPSTLKGEEVVYSYLVDDEGNLSDCKIETAVSDIPGSLAKRGPWICPPSKVTQIFKDASGKPVPKRVRITNKVEFTDP